MIRVCIIFCCLCMTWGIHARSIISIYLPVWPVRIIGCHIIPCICTVIFDLSKPHITLLCVNIITNPVIIILYGNNVIACCTIFCRNAKCHSIRNCICVCQYFVIRNYTYGCGTACFYILFYFADSCRILLGRRNLDCCSCHHVYSRF